jgi:YHS domain-containing protein
MKTAKMYLCCLGIALATLSGCSMTKGAGHEIVYEVDPVCKMKVDKSEAYVWKYKGNKYFFDTYNCKETFKMNPEKFLAKGCADTTTTK